MVQTNLIPWEREAIIVTITTKRELTPQEERTVCQAYAKLTPPWRPYKSLSNLVEELENEGFYYLASLIVFPD